MTTPVWVGLGSNLGDRKGILDATIAGLIDTPGVSVEAVSTYHETSPVGGPPGQGPFLNAAARLGTVLEPEELLAATQALEDRLGRVRTVRWGERTLDIDLLIYGCTFLDTDRLKLPHPRLAFRRFVLAPLAEIGPEIVDTRSGRTIAYLLEKLNRIPRTIAIHGPPGRSKSIVLRRLIEELPAALAEESRSSKGEPLVHGEFDHRWVVADSSLFLGPIPLPSVEPIDGVRRASEWLDILTFTVVLPGEKDLGRAPLLLRAPLLWPESSDPDLIVEEVLATCRDIEFV